MRLSRALEIKDRLPLRSFISPTVLGWELQVPGQRGSQAARWGCERECARVRVCARVAFRQLSRPPPHPTHQTRPCAPPPPLAVLGAPRAAARLAGSPAPGRRPPCAPGSKAPALQLQPLRGAGRRKGWCGSQKSPNPQPAALSRDGQRALKFVTVAADSWPQPGTRRANGRPRSICSWRVRPAVPGPSALWRPQAPVLRRGAPAPDRGSWSWGCASFSGSL